MKSIAIIILAAGKSSRMKAPKQLLKIKNKTLLQHTIDVATKIEKATITCVLGANHTKILNEVSSNNIDFIVNKNYEKGLSSSIIYGINHFAKKDINFDGILIMLADQPEIKIEYYTEMCRLFSTSKNKIIATKYTENLGVPALFPNSYCKNLLLVKGDKGAKDFLNQHKKNVLFPDLKVNLIDLDTPEEYDSYTSFLIP